MTSTALVARPKTDRPSETEVEAKDTRTDAEQLLTDTDAMLDKIDEVLDEQPTATDCTPFTLADAIREGSKLHPQAIGMFTGPKGETCALSAALEAVKARGLI
jgi:hypothetical protein